MARMDVTKNTACSFGALSVSLMVIGFEVDHFHGTDDDRPDHVVHISTDGANSDLRENLSTQDWTSLVADEWHK